MLAMVAAGGVSLPASAAPKGDCVAGSDWGALRRDDAQRVVVLVNQHRAAKGLAPLATSPTLTAAAEWKSRHMTRYGYFSHDDPAPPVARTPSERLEACGYPGSVGWGENIAYGQRTAEAAMTAWLGSPGHLANIERASFRAIGVGVAVDSAGRPYWTQEFGAVADAGSSTPPAPGATPPGAAPTPSPSVPPTPGPPAGGSGPSAGPAVLVEPGRPPSCRRVRGGLRCRLALADGARGTRVSARLTRRGKTFAGGSARAAAGAEQLTLRLQRRRRVPASTYTLRLGWRDAGGRRAAETHRVRIG